MSKASEVTNESFDKLLQSELPVLVDFHAAWCGPCRMMSPIVDQLSADMEGVAIVAKLNVDDNQDVAAKYGVRNIPAFLVFKNGEVVQRTIGTKSITELKALLQ